jgi:hypothetical protein
MVWCLVKAQGQLYLFFTFCANDTLINDESGNAGDEAVDDDQDTI